MATPLQPPPRNLDKLSLESAIREMSRWMYEVFRRLRDMNLLAITWTSLDFTGSKLSDIATRTHAMLQSILGVDVSSVDPTKDKHVSNSQGKAWTDHGAATSDVHGIGAASSVVGTVNTQTLANKTLDGGSNTIQNLALASLKVDILAANRALIRNNTGAVTALNGIPDTTDMVTINASQTLLHKTMDGYQNIFQNIPFLSLETVVSEANMNIYRDSAGAVVAGFNPFVTKAVDYTLDAADKVVKVTAACTITVPTSVGVTGKVYIIDNEHAGQTSVVPTGAETIEGETSQILYGSACMQLYSDGVNWRIQ